MPRPYSPVNPKAFQQPGNLVRTRGRNWIVLPSEDPDLLRLKPLGGHDDDVTGIYLPLNLDEIVSSEFNRSNAIGIDDLGDLESALLLHDAARLSFRDAAGPFRSLARLSFRPRAYQMVPLIMALKQAAPQKLLIADDVGIGKTIEALLIVKELLERREIRRFAVICPPHLCEQWQKELLEKFGVEAVIIRSNTQAHLDRKIQGNTSVFDYYPFQVISVDYIKQDNRRPTFVQEAPELVIVDEAHSCTNQMGAPKNRQQRYHLLKDLSEKKGQGLILLTATPHSGNPGEFQSLLGLLNTEFAAIPPAQASERERERLAAHFVQRRRADVAKWMGEKSSFPERDTTEYHYPLHPDYYRFYLKFWRFLQGLMRRSFSSEAVKRIHYWSVLGMLRGVMSSPEHGQRLIQNRLDRHDDAPEDSDNLLLPEDNPVLDGNYAAETDTGPDEIIEKTSINRSERDALTGFMNELEALKGSEKDFKLKEAATQLAGWLKEKRSPVVFCRYIATARYLGAQLKQRLQADFPDLALEVITSEDPDDVRRARIDDMVRGEPRLLVATDCLSEGINLQELFDSVLHYDLPWNPNRLEQREGRVDRFGQQKEIVKASILIGDRNPMDQAVLRVLVRKVREIRKATGISIPFAENNQSFVDAIVTQVMEEAAVGDDGIQLNFIEGDQGAEKEALATRVIEEAAEREKATRSIFAQYAIKAQEIETDLNACDEAIGTPGTVRNFALIALRRFFGAQISPSRKGFDLYTANLPDAIRSTLPNGRVLKISFESPTPAGHLYIGRNHPFIEQLCHFLLAHTLEHNTKAGPARASVVYCREVALKTTLCLFRVRNVIESKTQKNARLVAEEMLLWGFKGRYSPASVLEPAIIQELLARARPSRDFQQEAQFHGFLEPEMKDLAALEPVFHAVAKERAENLIAAHERFRRAMSKKGEYTVVEPVLPMDLMGVYILLPEAGEK